MRYKINQQQLEKENEDKFVYIGNKIDAIYCATIVHKFASYDYIYLKVFQHKLAKVQELKHELIWLGVYEVEKRLIINEPDKNDVNTINKIWVIKWEVVPPLKRWREEVKKMIENGEII